MQAGSIDVGAGDLTSTGGSIDVIGDDVNVTAGAELRADGATSGGTIRVLAEQTARAYGDFSARGGAAGGDGGFIETSGHTVDIGGTFNAGAANGAAGQWLLDPTNIDIDAALAATTVATLETGTNVTIQTVATGGDPGNITVSAPISKDDDGGDVTLTLIAHNDILVNELIESTDGEMTVNLQANRNISINASINANGGAIGAAVDLDEATTNDAATLTIGAGATLTASSIQFDGLATVQDDTLRVLRTDEDTATWTIDGTTGTNAGTVAGTGLSTADFFQFGHLTGGDQADTFTFSNVNGTIAGTASGAGGDDAFVVDNGVGAAAYDGGAGASDDLDFTGSTGPVRISSGAVTGVELVTDSGDAEDVLQGTSGNDTFTTTGDDEVTFGTVVFVSLREPRGLGRQRHFNLNDDISGTTGVDGGADSDTRRGGCGGGVCDITAANVR